MWTQKKSLGYHSFITFTEIILGIICGTILGTITAIIMTANKNMQETIKPIIIASQALPVFALAPLLVLWFGLGLGSKIAMATIIIYFPIAAAFSDGLSRTQQQWIDIAKLNNATTWQIITMFRIPAAVPSLASGIRVAVNVAPIGAIVGEWVGAAAGLGYIINQANARMQTDIVFAALVLLIIMVITLRWIVDKQLDKIIHWVPKT